MKKYNIHIYPKGELLAAWKRDHKLFDPDAVRPPRCLRCGQPLCDRLADNALSRALDVYVCPQCGMDEALRDASYDPLPIREWWAVREGHLPQQTEPDSLSLVPVCSFNEVFQQGKTEMGYPPALVVYSRNDYDGYKWWTTWITCQRERPSSESVEEIDAFQKALFQLPEFKTLQTMARMCRQSAEPTSESTEFNLYSETEHFYIWLRLITRKGDYNLYTKYFSKESI